MIFSILEFAAFSKKRFRLYVEKVSDEGEFLTKDVTMAMLPTREIFFARELKISMDKLLKVFSLNFKFEPESP